MDRIFNLESESEFNCVLEKLLTICFDTQSTTDNDAAKEEIENMILQTNCDTDKLDMMITSKGYDKNRIVYFLQLIQSRRNQLLYSIIIRHNSKHGEVISSFDWILKLIFGTNELKFLKYPLLQLTFKTYNNGEQIQKTFDVNREMVATLINILETSLI